MRTLCPAMLRAAWHPRRKSNFQIALGTPNAGKGSSNPENSALTEFSHSLGQKETSDLRTPGANPWLEPAHPIAHQWYLLAQPRGTKERPPICGGQWAGATVTGEEAQVRSHGIGIKLWLDKPWQLAP